jgi:hypothetical protein
MTRPINIDLFARALVAANYTEEFAQREGRELPLLGVGR